MRPNISLSSIVDALFGLQHDIVCIQALYHMHTPEQEWCMPGKHCAAFVSMCVDRPTCVEEEDTSLEAGVPLQRPKLV
jgi:hypothetical protein